MWVPWFGLEARRRRLLPKTTPGPLQDYYKQAFIGRSTRIDEIVFAVLDFETTGLDFAKDHIVSIGMVEIKALGIPLNSAWHQIVATPHDIPQRSAIIHQITDDMVAQGIALEEAMRTVLQRLQGKVLVAHSSAVELGFLNKICQSLYQQVFLIPTIDTLYLAKRQMQRQHEVVKSGSLRLFNLRKKYGLPSYKAHNALSDALATAELFLALLNDMYPKHSCRLKDLLVR